MRDASIGSQIGDTVIVDGKEYIKTAGTGDIKSYLAPVDGGRGVAPIIEESTIGSGAIKVGDNVITDTVYDTDPYTGSVSTIATGPGSFVDSSGQDVTGGNTGVVSLPATTGGGMGFAGSATPTTVTPTDGGGMNLSGVDTGGGGQQYGNEFDTSATSTTDSGGVAGFASDVVDGFNNALQLASDAYYQAGGGFYDMLGDSIEGAAKYADMGLTNIIPSVGPGGFGPGGGQPANITFFQDVVGSGGDTGEDTGLLKFIQDTGANVYSGVSEDMQNRISQNVNLAPGTTLKDIFTGKAKTVGGGGIFDDKGAMFVRGMEDAYDIFIDVVTGRALGKAGLALVAGASAGEGFNSASEQAQGKITEFINSPEGAETMQLIADQQFGGNLDAAVQEARNTANFVAGVTSGPIAGFGDAVVASTLGGIGKATGLPSVITSNVLKVPAGTAGAAASGGATGIS